MPFVTPDGVTVIVEAALDASIGTYGVWDNSLWDSAAWGPDVVFQDVSPWLRSFETHRKFSRDLQVWEAGTATVTLNNFDGRFSPSNLDPAAPYVTGGVTGIRPWRPMRIRTSYNGQLYDLYRGYALAWQENYAQAYPGGGGAYVTVPCVDEFGMLARFDGFAAGMQGAGELSGLRIHRILDNAGHSGKRDIDPGRVALQGTDLSQPAITELVLTADSEGGAVYVNRTGTIIYDHRYALIENTRSNTVNAVFGDRLDLGDLPYADIATAYDGDLTTNIAAFAKAGGSAQSVDDPTSRALYGDKRYTRTDLLCQNDADVRLLAEFWVQQYAQPELRITSVDIVPSGKPDLLYPQVFGREVRDLVRARRTPPGGHEILRDVHIAGIHHNLGADMRWKTTFDLWSAEIYQGIGRWGAGVWDQSKFFF